MSNVTTKNNHKGGRDGFSIIELVVTVGIMALIATVVLVQNQGFNQSVRISNLAYDIALTIRQAQVYGSSVRQTSEGSFDSGYGVHFDSNTPASYVFFVDLDTDNSYDGGSEVFDAFTIGGGHHVDRFCVDDGGDIDCSGSSSVETLTIVFNRPLPNAEIFTNVGSGYDAVQIFVQSPRGAERSVLVQSSGQVSVQGQEE